MSVYTPTSILLLGAGELGSAILPHLASLSNIHITLGVRSVSKHTSLASGNVNIRSLDIATQSLSSLADIFAGHDILISCTGFGQSDGTQVKLLDAVLEAGKQRKELGKDRLWYFPWQWGVDYDVTGDVDGSMPLFGEQLRVRNLLREKAAQSHVQWTILSTGIFMSFLFESFWGVVEKAEAGVTVRCLRDWDHKVAVTDVHDIGKVLARIVAGDVASEDRVMYCAGDVVTYGELASIVERVSGREVKREIWAVSHLKEELAKDPDNLIKKYRMVFAGEGVWWDMEKTVNHQLGISLTDVEAYVRDKDLLRI